MNNINNQKKYLAGAVAGLAGGIVFGGMMQAMDVMPMVAALVGSTSVFVGWLVHLVISVIIALFFVWWFGMKSTSLGKGAAYGVLHGFIWWILGALIAMPVMLGMGVQFANMFERMNVLSLVGHLVYGVIVGLVFVKMNTSSRMTSI